MSSRGEAADDRQPSSVASAILNMINAVLGAGIVSLPYAWAQAGFTLGWVLFVATALITCYTLELLIDAADPLCRRGDINIVAYEQLAELILGKVGRFLVILAQFLYAFGISIGYVVIINDDLSTAMGQLSKADWFEDNSKLLTIIAAVVILLPPSMLRDVSGLAKASFFCFVSAFALVTIFGYELGTDRDHICSLPTPMPGVPADVPPADAPAEMTPNSDVLGEIDKSICDPQWTSFAETTVFNIYGIFVFTKACHHTQFQIFRSLGNRADPQLWKFVVRWSIILCSIITSTCAMLVYAIFGVQVESDFFKSFVKDNTAVSLGRLMFSTLIMMSFPMQLFVTRETLQVMITMWLSRNVTEKDRNELAALAEAEHAVPALNTYASSEPGSARPSPTRRSTARSRYSTIDRKSRTSEVMSAAGGDIRGETSNAMHFGTTLFLFAITIGIGLSTDNLGKVLNLVGGVAGSLIAFLIPGLIGINLNEKTGLQPTLGRPAAFAVTAFGVVTIVISSIFTFVSV